MHKQRGLPSLGLVSVLDLEKSDPEVFSLADDYFKSESLSEETANGFGREAV